MQCCVPGLPHFHVSSCMTYHCVAVMSRSKMLPTFLCKVLVCLLYIASKFVVCRWHYVQTSRSVTQALCLCTDLGTMVADVMHPDLVSLQPCYGGEDFMDTVEAPPLRTGTVTASSSVERMSRPVSPTTVNFNRQFSPHFNLQLA